MTTMAEVIMNFVLGERIQQMRQDEEDTRKRVRGKLQRNSKEEKLRRELEHEFKTNFAKIRPEWLKRKNKRNLELDCYSAKLNLAVEYNGEQHYKTTGKFMKTYTELREQQERDKFKALMCARRNICLVVIKYDVPQEQWIDYVRTNYTLWIATRRTLRSVIPKRKVKPAKSKQ